MNDPITILLVEDFDVMRKAQVKVLAHLGYQSVVEARDGKAAVDILNDRTADDAFDLIISDWNMPAMDGLALLEWVRASDVHKDVPFIIATAQAETQQAARATEKGVSAFISKPFEPGELRSAIETVLTAGTETDREDPSPAAKARPSPKTRIRVAHIQITDHLALGVLDHLIRTGEMVPERFELDIRCMPGWNPVQDALGRGEVDAAFVLAPMGMDFFAGGMDVRLVLFAHRNGSICVRNAGDATEASLHDSLKGKTFFLPHMLSIHHMLADLFLREIGLKLGPAGTGPSGAAADVFYEVVPPIQMPAYLMETPGAGGFIVAEPIGTKAIHEGAARPMFLSGELWENHPCCVLLVQQRFIEENEEAVAELVDRLTTAGRYIGRNPEPAARIALEFLDPDRTLGLNLPLLESVLTEPRGVSMDDMFPATADLDKIQRYMTAEMGIGRPIDLDRFVDPRFARAAIGDAPSGRPASTLRDAAAIVAGMINRRMTEPAPDAPPRAFTVAEDDTSIRFEISSEMALVDRVVADSRRFLHRLGFETFSEFKLVLRELLINAVEHGNRRQPDRTATCVITLLPGGESTVFKIEVTDEGEGFDHRRLDMSIPRDARQVRNRGFAIVNALSRKIEFNEAGNRVTAYVKLERETRFDVTEDGDWTVIRPTGDITAAVADKFRALLDRRVEKGGTRFRFDLARVGDIDSVGLSSFLILHKILSDRDPELVLENVSDDLRRFFRMIRLDRSYTIRSPKKGDG